jgi:hypothetical protein
VSAAFERPGHVLRSHSEWLSRLGESTCVGGQCTGFGGGGQSCVTTDSGGACASCIAAGNRVDYQDNFGCAGQPLAQTGPTNVSVSYWSGTSVMEGGRYRAGATAASPCAGATPTSCTVNDVLVAEFSSTTPGTCTVSTEVRIGVGKPGIDIFDVTAGCIPDGYILDKVEDDGKWRVRKFVGDPAEPSYGLAARRVRLLPCSILRRRVVPNCFLSEE